MKMNKHLPVIVLSVGVALILLGFMLDWYILPMLIDKAKESMVLREGTPTTQMWKQSVFPIKFKVYFFSILNPDEVQNGANPKIQEIGPFIYDKYWMKHNIVINDTLASATYMNQFIFSFNQQDSGCRSDTDVVTIINPSIVGTALQVEAMMPAALSMVNDAIPLLFPGTKDAFLRIRVRDILFDGMELSCASPNVAMLCTGLRGAAPATIRPAPNGRDFRFSMLSHLNGTLSGPFEVDTGAKNLLARGTIKSYQQRNILEFWSGPSCNMINGTDGLIYPPIPGVVDRLYIFVAEICRSIFFHLTGLSNFKGLMTMKFQTFGDLFALSPENICFCGMKYDDDGNPAPQCSAFGTMDITPCIKGPVLVSNPHFLDADPRLVQFAQGLKPVPEKHQSYVEIEPMNGIPLSSRMRIQYNAFVKRFDEIDILQNVSEGVYPIIWIEQGSDMPDFVTDGIKKGYHQLKLLKCAKWALIIVGVAVIIIAAALTLYSEKLLCFAKTGKIAQNHTDSAADLVPEESTNGNAQFPKLYPHFVAQRNMVNRVGGPQVWEYRE